jgi:glucose-1-phosphate thymidylyltransferase
MMAASEFVEVIEKRQGLKIACLEEIAYRKGFINQAELVRLADEYGANEYSKYLKLVSDGTKFFE